MFSGGQEAGAQDIVRKVAGDEGEQVELKPLLRTLDPPWAAILGCNQVSNTKKARSSVEMDQVMGKKDRFWVKLEWAPKREWSATETHSASTEAVQAIPSSPRRRNTKAGIQARLIYNNDTNRKHVHTAFTKYQVVLQVFYTD